MDPARRRKYLDALELESWVLRGNEPPAEVADEAPEQPVAASPRRSRFEASADSAPAAPEAPEVIAKPPLVLPRDWAGLREAAAQCRHCGLCETRQQAVFGVGVERAELMVVGEGPGAEEDRQGEPFVGQAGQLLDRMLAAIGHSRQRNVYIANVVKCRPPGNRDPKEDEAEACRPFLEAQLELVQPKLILALGRVAAQRLLNSSEPLARLRGQQHSWGPQSTPLLATYHPAYLLRSPREKAKAWADLKQALRMLEATA